MEHKGITLSTLEELLPAVIFGAEDEGDGDSSNSGDDSNDGDNGDAGSDDNSQDDNTGGHDDANDPKVRGLKSALEKERARAAKAEKELARRNKADEDKKLAEKSEIEQAQIKQQRAEDRMAKLTTGYVNLAVEREIEKQAQDFIDSDDALKGVDRASISFEQDEDDPSNVKVDAKTVKAALDKLRTKKAHLLKPGTDDGEPTGGQFGRGGQKKKSTTEDELRKKYPSL